MPRAESGPSRAANARRKLWRVLCLLWSAVLLVAILAQWPYAVGAALFATFVHFAAVDEQEDMQREPGG